jgi:TetR/AcrR family fatty acid metabolism transcriptional regulator
VSLQSRTRSSKPAARPRATSTRQARVEHTAPIRRGDKRERILRAASEVFAEHGFTRAQVADVARAAGVAAGTVYLYFDNKDALLVSIFEQTMAWVIAQGRTIVDEPSEPKERLTRLAQMHLGRLGRDRPLAIVIQVEMRHSLKYVKRFSYAHVRDYLALIEQVIADGQSRGAFRKGLNPKFAAKVFFGALDEAATSWILSRRRYKLGALADPVVDLFVHGARTS